MDRESDLPLKHVGGWIILSPQTPDLLPDDWETISNNKQHAVKVKTGWRMNPPAPVIETLQPLYHVLFSKSIRHRIHPHWGLNLKMLCIEKDASPHWRTHQYEKLINLINEIWPFCSFHVFTVLQTNFSTGDDFVAPLFLSSECELLENFTCSYLCECIFSSGPI